MYRDFWLQGFLQGKPLIKAENPFFNLQGIPVILRFPVDLTGNPCYIYTHSPLSASSTSANPTSAPIQLVPFNFH